MSAHRFPISAVVFHTEKATKTKSTESVTLDLNMGDCYIIGANR